MENFSRENDEAAVIFTLGNFYLRDGKLSEAKASFSRALEKHSDFEQARQNLGQVAFLQEQYDDAIGIFQKLIGDGKANAEVYLMLGHALVLTDHPVAAENAYRHAMTLQLDNPAARQGLLRALIAQERYPEASKMLDELMLENPEAGELWTLKANLALALGRDTEALTALESARRLGVTDNTMKLLLGDLYFNRRLYDEALNLYLSVADAKTVPVDHLLNAARGFVEAGQTVKARELLKNMKAEKNPVLLELEGDIARADGDMKQAAEKYEAILRDEPLRGSVLIKSGKLAEEGGEPAKAEILYRRAESAENSKLEALLSRARLYAGQGKYAEAIPLLESALALDDKPYIRDYLKAVQSAGSGD
ncbi:MAG: tetratricopeptide repeat protein [Kiritimatiellia bacterium]